MNRRSWCAVAVAFLAACPAAALEIIHVPGDVPTLQAAVAQISVGGIIEMAPGTYSVPTNGFIFNNLGKGFTVRAPVGAGVVLDGANANPVARFINSSPALGGPIVFERLTFYRGRSTSDGLAGGITLARATATFIDCVFESNTSDAPSTGGAGVMMFAESTAHFFGCQWIDNRVRSEAGGLRVDESTAYLHACRFTGNLANLPNHRSTAAGGGVHVTNGTVRLGNTRFEANEAGYVGGGLYVLGTWADPVEVPRADAVVANCTFVDNQAMPDGTVTPPAPTEGGAMHVESQARGRVFNSRFVTNTAYVGGALSLSRAEVEVASSVFQGNRAVVAGAGSGVGGAVTAGSNDIPEDGTENRPSAYLVVTDSLVQGRYGQVGSAAKVAAGIFAVGDTNRRWGLNGVWPAASADETRATVWLANVALVDCDATEAAGGIEVDLANLVMTDSLVINADVTDSGSSGAGLRVITESIAIVLGTTLARNTAALFGGGVYVQGADVEIGDSRLIENRVASNSYGAALFAAPMEDHYGTQIDVTGEVRDNIISNTSYMGTPIFDDDRQPGPINDVRYNGNMIFERQFGNAVYHEALVGLLTVPQLNALVVTRSGGPSTDKSQVANTNPSTAPVVGNLLAVPSSILPLAAAGDDTTTTASYLAYAWSGGSATLDGTVVAGNAGLTSAGVGSHVLQVAGQSFTASVAQGVAPAAQLIAVPAVISSGQTSSLLWSTPAGAFVDASLDQGVTISPSPSGQVVVAPLVTTTYRLIVITEEGSATAETTVWVDEPVLFADGFESGSTEAWSSVVP